MPETFSYNGSKLALAVKNKFGDTGGVQITDAMILEWINNGVREIVQQNPFLMKTASTGVLAGQNIYDLGALFSTSRMFRLDMVTLNGKSLKIVPLPEFQAYVTDSAPEDSNGYPVLAGGRPQIGTIYADKLTLWPIPQKTIAAAIVIFFRAYPADLVSMTDALTVPDRLYNALFDYVTAQAHELAEDSALAQVALSHFQDKTRREYERENNNPNDFYPAIMPDPYDENLSYNLGGF